MKKRKLRKLKRRKRIKIEDDDDYKKMEDDKKLMIEEEENIKPAIDMESILKEKCYYFREPRT